MSKKMVTNFRVCQGCGDPVDIYDIHCDKCLAKMAFIAYRQRVDTIIPRGKFFGGFETFPIKKYAAFLPIVTKAMEWADAFHLSNKYVEDVRGLFFAGLPGIGKTGIAYAILRRVGERGFKIGCSTVPDLFSRYTATWTHREESERDIMNEFLDNDLVLFDDLGAESQEGKPGIRNAEYLYLLINKANERDKPIFIVTSNLGDKGKKEAYGKTPNGQRVLPRFKQMTASLGDFPAINLREADSK